MTVTLQLLLTATPHKGDPENFSLFLQLLDRDAYADVKSIRQAMDRRYAPFYLRSKIPEFVERGEFGLASGQKPEGIYERLWFKELLPCPDLIMGSRYHPPWRSYALSLLLAEYIGQGQQVQELH